MKAPSQFIVRETFRHTRPELVRAILRRYGFERRVKAGRTDQGRQESEIWALPDSHGGYWLVRIDATGHDTWYHFGQRPHYHKEWVDSESVLNRYLREYTPEAWIYSDSGLLIGRAGGGEIQPDRKAKVQHILR
ncbi:MAG: hypothetical protein GXP27_06170 [Planctomycetes bacterium]|nr:hypothetical protein [Planctomycetota bacterium]